MSDTHRLLSPYASEGQVVWCCTGLKGRQPVSNARGYPRAPHECSGSDQVDHQSMLTPVFADIRPLYRVWYCCSPVSIEYVW
jgi:hypothetical protein